MFLPQGGEKETLIFLYSNSVVNNLQSHFGPQVQKLAITVELLLGDIPDRAIFRQPTMRKTLQPYFQLTQGETRKRQDYNSGILKINVVF